MDDGVIDVSAETGKRGSPPIAWLARHWPLLLIVPVFVALGVLYSVTVPIFETPDEPLHYAYVYRLAQGQGLPPISLSANEWEQGEAHQPPLYYAIGALLTRGITIAPDEALYVRNPYSARGEPDAPGNKNVVLHTGDDPFPYQGVSLAVHLLRWFSVLCSAATVAFTYALALAIAPTRREIAAGAAALVAFNPQFVFNSASVSNDSLVTLLTTLVLYLSVRVIVGLARPAHAPEVWRPIALGALAGLAALTKLSGLAAALLIPCAYVGLTCRQRANLRLRDCLRRNLLRPLAIAGVVLLLLAGWWYARNAIVYHDPLGMRAIQVAFSKRETLLPWPDVAREMLESFVSYWGVFGWMNVLTDEFFYTLVRVLSILGGVGAVLFVARVRWRLGTLRDHRWPAVLLLLIWIATMLASLASWTRTITGPQGRLLFPAIAAIAVLLFAGLTAWLPRRFAPHVAVGVAALLATLCAIIPSRSIAPAYAQPRRIALEETPPDMRGLDIRFGDQFFLLGYDLGDDSVPVGESLHLRLYWVALTRMSTNHTFYVHIFGQQGERIGSVDTYPGGGNYPTTLWVPGDVICEEYAIPVDREAAAPVAARVRVGVYGSSSQEYLPATDARGTPLDHNPVIAQVRVAPRQAAGYQPAHPLSADFANKLRLDGYALRPAGFGLGDTWQISLYWHLLGRTVNDYTVFVHLVDQAGQIVSQVDEQPQSGDYPTSFWQIGDSVEDTHCLQLSQTLAPGEYYLHVGLYLLETNERLAVLGEAEPADHVTIGPITIEGAQ
jgi:4-amino-4-deoxy-L-arabinose transferase-like glycosyltransferase